MLYDVQLESEERKLARWEEWENETSLRVARVELGEGLLEVILAAVKVSIQERWKWSLGREHDMMRE